MIIIFFKPRYLVIGLLYADDENESRVTCNTMQMLDQNSLAGELLKVKLVEIDKLIKDKRVRRVESIATVLSYFLQKDYSKLILT